MTNQQTNIVKILKATGFVLCLLPAAWLGWRAYGDALGANPIETITRDTGVWTLRLLLITLLVTPLRRLTGWNVLQRLRRMLGLFAFFYACLHFTTYIWLDKFFAWPDMVKDVIKRPFITVGFLGFVLLLPLAATSTNKMMKRLGRRWQTLHRLAYAIPALGVLHYLWLVKADIRAPLWYGVLLSVLLGVRLWWLRRKRIAIQRARPARVEMLRRNLARE